MRPIQERPEPVYNLAMNRITRCTSCATVYHLGDAHLQAAHGWLRCGVCGHVFDSAGLVLRWTPLPADSVAPAPIVQESSSGQSALEAQASDRIALDELLQKEDRSVPIQARPAQAELAAFEQALSSFKPEPLRAANLTVAASEPARAASSAWLAPYALITLVLLLILQLAFVQRHAIAAHWPESESLIRHVCQSFGCKVTPIRDVEGVVIDSSSLVQRSQDHLLTWSVRNSTARALGMTALELSLLDGQGNVVLRRVLLSDQTGAPTLLQPGQSWSGALAVMVAPELGFSDYRLLSFYP